MGTIAESLYRDSAHGALQELPRAGTSLEHPLVYDSTARELQQLAQKGVVEIVERHVSGLGLVDRLRFRRIR